MSVKFPPSESLTAPLSKAQIRAIGSAMRYSILADVLLALSGIQVFGVSVFSGLSVWAEELQAKAQDAYNSAFNAQGSANYANAQLAILTGIGDASAVPGGVSVSAIFNGSAASTLGAGWTRTTAGPGAGSFGPNGSGAAAWDRSGGLAFTLFDYFNTPLATDYQAASLVLNTVPQTPDIFGGQAYNFLRLRSNTSNDTFVYCRIGYNSLRIGCYVSGTETVFDSISITPRAGDVWLLIVGTDVDDYEILVKQNGVTVWRDTDTAPVSQMGGSYLHAGMAETCSGRLIFTQTIPGEVTSWAAADRLDTSY